MPAKPKTLDQKQRKLWQALNSFISEHGGWMVSQPDTEPLRFECRSESELPESLRDLGYDVVSAGTGERLLPVIHETIRQDGGVTRITVQHVAPIVVSVFEIRLPVG